MARKKVRKLGVKRSARSTKGWRTAAAKGPSEREALYERCGATAFLNYNSRDPGYSEFPIVARTGPCAPDCRGLRAAYSRAKQYGKRKMAKKALRRANVAKCAWAR